MSQRFTQILCMVVLSVGIGTNVIASPAQDYDEAVECAALYDFSVKLVGATNPQYNKVKSLYNDWRAYALKVQPSKKGRLEGDIASQREKIDKIVKSGNGTGTAAQSQFYMKSLATTCQSVPVEKEEKRNTKVVGDKASSTQPNASQILSLSGKAPVNRSVSLSPAQVSQADYEKMMSCAAVMHGGHGIVVRLEQGVAENMKQPMTDALKKNEEVLGYFDSIAHDLPIMAPHLNRVLGQTAFDKVKAQFDATAALPIDAQEDYFAKHGTLKPDCVALSKRLVGLQAIYYRAQKSLEK